ncbi:MAG: prolyl oligopeptidase family serine peptidase [Bacteroidota bacterium]
MKKFLIIVSLMVIGEQSYGQEPRDFQVKDLFEQHNVLSAAISPDSKYAAIVIERPKKEANIFSYRGVSYRKDIWLLDLESTMIRKILDGQLDSSSFWNPVWAPDSKKMALLSTKGEDNIKAYVFNIDSNDFIEVSDRGVNLMTKTYQGESGLNDPYLWVDAENLVVSLLSQGKSYNTFQMDYLPLETITRDWNHAKYNTASTASLLDTDSLYQYRTDENAQLVKFNVVNRELTLLDRGYFRHVLLSPQKEALFVVKRKGGKRLGDIDLITSAWNFYHQAGIIDVNRGASYFIGVDTLDAYASVGRQLHFWGKDGNYMITRNSARQYTGYIDVKQLLFKEFPKIFSAVEVYEGEIYLKSSEGWVQFDSETAKTLVSDPPSQVFQRPKIDGRMLAVNSDSSIILVEIRDGLGRHIKLLKREKEEIVVSYNEWIKEITPYKKELISFEDEKGIERQALLINPNSKESKGLVVNCYPGTIIGTRALQRDYRHSENFLNPLILASKGYHVLLPTIDTESTDEFFEYPGFVVPATQAALKKKNLHPEKVAIMGLSHGGYLVYAMLTQVNLFKSAIAIAGYGNHLSFYGNFDVRYRYTENPFENVGRLRASESGAGSFGVPPFNNQEKYLKNSPVMYTQNIETPLMIIQGDKDFVSIEQGEEIFTHLYRQGKKARFVRFWGEGHNINAPKNIERMWNEIFTWLNHTLN